MTDPITGEFIFSQYNANIETRANELETRALSGDDSADAELDAHLTTHWKYYQARAEEYRAWKQGQGVGLTTMALDAILLDVMSCDPSKIGEI